MARYIEYVKRNIRRSPFQALAASMVMFFTFFALLVFLLLASGSQAILRHYESKPQVIAFFKDGTTQQDVEAIKGLLTQQPKVIKIKYVSKEEALQIYKEQNKKKPELLELVTAKFLPASLEVSTQTPADLKPVAEILRREPVVEEVAVPEDVVATLTAATRFIRVVGGATVSFLAVFATLEVLMIIGFKIRLRKDEIEIMRLLGASSPFIRVPFILEGMFYGMVGAIISWILTYTLLWYFTPFLKEKLDEVQLLPVDPLFMLALLGSSLVIAVVIGGLGSLGAVRRYLHA